MQRLLVLLGAVLFFTACNAVCLTVYDACRDEPMSIYPAAPDAFVEPLDGGTLVDAGFLACVSAGCETACANVVAFTFVCLNPQCVECQRDASDGGNAVFCGRVFSCGRDASVVVDAAAGDAAVGDAAPRLDAAGTVDAAAAGMDAGPPMDAAIMDAG